MALDERDRPLGLWKGLPPFVGLRRLGAAVIC